MSKDTQIDQIIEEYNNTKLNDYMLQEKALLEECKQAVLDGEMTADEAKFRFYMSRDEILYDMYLNSLEE